MALIKCPECGQNVSTEATACPHCGYPLNKVEKEQKVEKSEIDNDKKAPLDPSWLKKYKFKPTLGKIILGGVALGSLISFIISIVIAVAVDYYSLFIIPMIFGIIFIFALSFFFAGLIVMKWKVVEDDGYRAIAIAGFFRYYLVVENEVQEVSMNRHLDGRLPNGKYVWADFAAWDGNIIISVDSSPCTHGRKRR